ncbi:hypothetical protein D9758_007477 [Tetrapyrgos nigripes]|uniref:DUF6533 domain-containing protein n=1 Tax=Tetrapyrgos nigripes TaxID=182062 RepID=A0A8H5LHG9_9AGAR|nr:hypothetical protein D9758_007477 [Tetrapyrgos nigripes]
MAEVDPLLATTMLAPSTFLLYDHLLTLGMEIQYIWLKPKRRSAYWFFTLRYFATIGEIVIFVFRFYDAGSVKGCLRLQTFINVHTVLVELLVVLLMSMRVYALYECSKKIMWFLISVAACLLGAVGWSIVKTLSGTALLQGMVCGRSFPEQSVSAYDCLIFALTIWKTYKTRNDYTGVIYFGVISAVHLANLILSATRSSKMSALTRVVSAAMTSRLMLNLHECASDGVHIQGASAFVATQNSHHIHTTNSISAGMVFRRHSLDEDDLEEYQDRPGGNAHRTRA